MGGGGQDTPGMSQVEITHAIVPLLCFHPAPLLLGLEPAKGSHVCQALNLHIQNMVAREGKKNWPKIDEEKAREWMAAFSWCIILYGNTHTSILQKKKRILCILCRDAIKKREPHTSAPPQELNHLDRGSHWHGDLRGSRNCRSHHPFGQIWVNSGRKVEET